MIKIFIYFFEKQRQLQQLQAANLETELAYLKNQLNPHFLFNALNNLHVLSEKYPDRVASNIENLSAMLRYQLYESKKDRVLLRNEIAFLENYIEAFRQRSGNSEIKLEVNGNTAGVSIPPLLFLPFVENATKHGLNAEGESEIAIKFDLKEDGLHFFITNTIPAAASISR